MIVNQPQKIRSEGNMNSLMKFDFGNNKVRFCKHPEGKFEFGVIAKDVAISLEYKDNRRLRTLVEEGYKGVADVATPGGDQLMKVFWEPGLYQVLARSNKPKAKPFQKRLYEEVLPEIRKTGKYDPDLRDKYTSALKEIANAQREIQSYKEQNDETLNRLNDAEITLGVYQAVLPSESCLDIEQTARALAIPGFGRNKLFNYLRRRDFICQKSTLPYQSRIHLGLALVETVSVMVNGRMQTKQKAMLTFSGLDWLIKRLKKDGYKVTTNANLIWAPFDF